MNSIKFVYYQHSYIQNIVEKPISETLSFKEIENNYTSKREGAYFASYITEFDCREETKWWFTIKSDEYDLSQLPSKKRYEITKAKKFCNSKKISPLDYKTELFECYKKSFEAYPEIYRPANFDYESFCKSCEEWCKEEYSVYACYYKENNLLIGFNLVTLKENILGLTMQKTNPEYEKYNSNASLIDCMLNDWNEKLKDKEVIISNGSRSIKQQTNFNSYLEKYFGFRKAYAKLRIVYKFPIGIIVKILKPFRFLLKNTKNPFLYNVYCVLKMDSLRY